MTEIYSLKTGAVLLSQTRLSFSASTDRLILYTASDDWRRVLIWDPLVPNRLSPVNLRDWHLIYQNGDLIVAERGEYFLFWVIGLGVCVRCLFSAPQWGEHGRAWLTNGVVLIDAPTAEEMVVYLVPLVATDCNDAPQHRVSATVPASVPLVCAREVYRGSLPQRLSAVPTSSHDPSRAPLLQSGSLWTLG